MIGALSLFACDGNILEAINFTTELQHIEHHPRLASSACLSKVYPGKRTSFHATFFFAFRFSFFNYVTCSASTRTQYMRNWTSSAEWITVYHWPFFFCPKLVRPLFVNICQCFGRWPRDCEIVSSFWYFKKTTVDFDRLLSSTALQCCALHIDLMGLSA